MPAVTKKLTHNAMHNLEHHSFDKETSKPSEGLNVLSEAEKVRAKTNLELKEFAEMNAVDSVIDNLLGQHLKKLNPAAQAFLQKNNKE